MQIVLLKASQGGCGFISQKIYFNSVMEALSSYASVTPYDLSTQKPFPASSSKTIWHFSSQELAHYSEKVPAGKKILTCHDLFDLTVSQPFIDENYIQTLRGGLSQINRFDRIIAISHDTEKSLVDFGCERQRIQVIAPSFNPDCFYPRKERSLLDKRFPFLKNGKKYTMHVGNSIERKNHLRALLSFADLAKDIKDVDYVLVTNNEQNPGFKEIKKALSLLDCRDRIHMVTDVTHDDLALLYSCSLCLFFPTLAEGFGLPIIEAMAFLETSSRLLTIS